MREGSFLGSWVIGERRLHGQFPVSEPVFGWKGEERPHCRPSLPLASHHPPPILASSGGCENRLLSGLPSGEKMPPMDCDFLSANRGAFQMADLTDIEERSPHKALQIFNNA